MATENTGGDSEGKSSMENEVPVDPLLGDFAVCLSGGGYRAAAFHLGALDVLTRLGLAEQIQTISTVSGGTIVGTAYALSQAKGQPFCAFYREFYETLLHRNVVADAFARLESNEDRAPSLIRAVASVYAEDEFTGKTTLGDLAENNAVPNELIFSATEFERGRAFRFQTSRRASVYVGSGSALSVPQAVWREIRLADIVAASSCFPSVFEPFFFPDDFAWEQPLSEIRKAFSATCEKSLPLMDGGTYDNQGVNGVRTVYQRQGMQLGWMLVSDGSPRLGADAFYEPSEPREGRITLKMAVALSAILFVLSLVSLASLTVGAAGEITRRGVEWGHDTFVYGVPVLLTLLVVFLFLLACKKACSLSQYVQDETGIDPWSVLRYVKLRSLLRLVRSRAESLIALTSGVFVKRVRGLIYTVLMEDEDYKDRVAFNFIYDLDQERPSLYKTRPELKPTPELRAMAQRAEEVKTTLWFAQREDLRDTIACGQATTCSTLLRYLYKHYPEENGAQHLPESESEEHQQANDLIATAEKLWTRVKEDPKSLLHEERSEPVQSG